VRKLRDQCGISEVVLVGDRGMIKQKQADALKEFDDVFLCP
jgi:hypothetical protein